MAFGPDLIQEPHNLKYRPNMQYSDDPWSDFTSNEVHMMNADRRKEEKFWMEEHQ